MHADRQIPGWFPEINRNYLIWLIESYSIDVVLEIGAFLGKSTVFFSQRVGMVYSIDHWKMECLKSEDEQKFVRELGLPPDFGAIFRDNIKQAAKASLEKSSRILALSPDMEPDDILTRGSMAAGRAKRFLPELVYIDGDHSYEAVRRDIERYGSLARKIICGDDYGVAEGVTRAVDGSFPEPGPVGSASRLHIAPPFWWVEVGG